MTEAAVHMLVEIEMIEGIDEVGPIKMGVHTEHLTENGLTDIEKVFGESTALANPVTRSGELSEGSVEISGTGRNRGLILIWGETT